MPPSPPTRNFRICNDGDGEFEKETLLLGLPFSWNDYLQNDDIDGSIINQTHNDTMLVFRGGSDEIIAGTKSTLQTATNYWSNIFDSIPTKMRSLLQRFNPFAKKKEDKSDELDLSNMLVQNVDAPESTVLPESVIRSAAQRSGLLGSVLRSDRVQECARHIKRWYLQRGYVLHSVTGATLHAENGTATLAVYEPRSASLPVAIRFAKLVPIDPESGQTTTMRKYKAKLETKRGRAFRKEEWEKIKSQLNTTIIEARGRTNPRIISKHLGLHAGQHFKWDGYLWQNIVQSGIFAKVFKANPVQLSDGSVQVQVRLSSSFLVSLIC